MSSQRKRGRPRDTPAIVVHSSVHPSTSNSTATTVRHFGTDADGCEVVSTRRVIVSDENPPGEPFALPPPDGAMDGYSTFDEELGYVHYIGATSQRKRYKSTVSN